MLTRIRTRFRARIKRERDDWLGVAFSATLGLGAGLLAGMVVGELFGNVSPERFKRAVGRLRSGDAADLDPHTIERAVQEALRGSSTTRELAIRVHALGQGLVELTGTAPDAAARRSAGDTARTIPGAEVVVNRILVEGDEIPVRKSVPPETR